MFIFEQMTSKRKITIAIDGFSSSGKSTLAKDLAKSLGYVFIDSGAMYRAVTFYFMQNGCMKPRRGHLRSMTFIIIIYG
jgi:cytidylate kinase